MTVEKLKNLEKVVENILNTSPKTRDDDYLLYGEVLRKCDPELLCCAIGEFFFCNRTLNVPNIKSVERARRKVQEKHPELASERAKKKRAEEQATYLHYVRDKT